MNYAEEYIALAGPYQITTCFDEGVAYRRTYSEALFSILADVGYCTYAVEDYSGIQHEHRVIINGNHAATITWPRDATVNGVPIYDHDQLTEAQRQPFEFAAQEAALWEI
jgi:hypothetical protein